MDTRFHAVYLLTSLDPKCKGSYYIGYTVHPLRRLRQHNGELTNGAWRTHRRGRPWELVCCVSGFSEDQTALKFEWMWQNPTKALLIKEMIVAAFGGHAGKHSSGRIRGIHYAIGVLHLLLSCHLFSSMMLQLNILVPEKFKESCELLQKCTNIAPLVERRPLFILKDNMSHDELRALIPNDNDVADEGENSIGDHDIDVSESQQTYLSGEGDDYASCDRTPTITGSPSRSRSPGSLARITTISTLNQKAAKGLLMCSLCGLALPRLRYMSCLSCQDAVSPGEEKKYNVRIGVDLSEDAVVNPTNYVACPFRAHIVCMALLFYYESDKNKTLHTNNESCGANNQIQKSLPCSSPMNSNQVHVFMPSQVSTVSDTGENHNKGPDNSLPELVPTNSIQCPLCTRQTLHWSVLAARIKQGVNAELQRVAASKRLELRRLMAAQEVRLLEAGLLVPTKRKRSLQKATRSGNLCIHTKPSSPRLAGDTCEMEPSSADVIDDSWLLQDC
eukprot:Tbor_TRINITY_DN5236_c2_g3::TRINITY_DN5236_c2_g3_i1::g.16810::m.16810/K15078/SLX1; structure-specific endonuclease subunit SLX1